MTPALWDRVQELVDEALSLPPEKRLRFVALHANGDVVLQEHVERMLEGWEQSRELQQQIGQTAAQVFSADLLDAGDRIGAWKVLSLIGHGGMGSVYRAERADGQFRQPAAIKLVRLGFGATEELLARFRSERQILARLTHPNLARLLDGGITPSGLPYLVMEFVEGEALSAYIQRIRPSITTLLEIVQQVCSAVQHAHQNLVVHRDLKPANIMVTAQGNVKLLDFGISKLLDQAETDEVLLTRPTHRLMTPEYASPEQIRALPITTSTDIYSLGVVLYEALTGQRPHCLNNLSPAEMERRILEEAPVPPSMLRQEPVSLLRRLRGKRRRITDLDRIVLKCLHTVPERRYSSVTGLSSDLQRYRDGFPVTARTDSTAYRIRRFVARHRGAVASATLFGIVVVGLSVTSALFAARARREAASAQAVASFLSDLFLQVRPDNTHGQSTSARELLDRGTARLESSSSQSPALHARLLATLGKVYYDLGDMGNASRLLLQAESIYHQQNLGPSVDLANAEYALGELELDRSNTASAQRHFAEALSTYTHVHGAGSTEVANVLDGQGEAQTSLGHFDEAERLLKQSIALHTKLLGPDAEPTLTDKHNLASVYNHLGDYQQERPLLMETLAAHRRTIGDLQEITTSDIGNLAWLEDRMGHFGRAETLSNEAISLKSKLFGASNPRLAMQFLVLGDVQRQTGRTAQARDSILKAMRMTQQFEGATSLHLAWDKDELGLIDLSEGKLPDARANLAAAETIRTRSTPQPLQDLALSYDHLGQLAFAEHDLNASQQSLRRALDLERAVFPRPNDSMALTETHLAQTLTVLGRTQEACQLLGNAAAISRSVFGEEPHPIQEAVRRGLSEAHCPR